MDDFTKLPRNLPVPEDDGAADHLMGKRAPGPSGTFKAISAGGKHTCAIRRDNTLACWGNNAAGEFSPPAGTFREISAGDQHTCAIQAQTADLVDCWGENAQGQSTPPTR
jgi:alpha-tubulin suppressor-like RCC1 family protein